MPNDTKYEGNMKKISEIFILNPVLYDFLAEVDWGNPASQPGYPFH
jgi:hypothetical protein